MKPNRKLTSGQTVHELCCDACRLLSRLYYAVHEGSATPKAFEEAHDLIAALPLTTSDFDLTSRRLGNARRYSEVGETGAATYELGLAERSLAKILSLPEGLLE